MRPKYQSGLFFVSAAIEESMIAIWRKIKA